MKMWLKKISVAIIAFITLGTYVPTIHYDTHAKDNDGEIASKPDSQEHSANDASETSEDSLAMILEEEADDTDDSDEFFAHVDTIKDVAKLRTIEKLGPRIVNQVENEFNQRILPGMNDVVDNLFTDMDATDASYLAITEYPSDGVGERIFNVHDYQAGRDIAKFHVRRDNRPWEGYFFNFHYHLKEDNFETHHEIGEIFWDKNEPPKWMA